MTSQPTCSHDLDPADSLRRPEEMALPDARMGSGTYAQRRLDGHHHAISGLTFGKVVPDDVRIHFETAKNLFLYSWCVYRFYMVAEQYALTTLEFGLRSKFIDEGLLKKDDDRVPGLKFLLRTARERDLISDAHFTPRLDIASELARHRHFLEVSQTMREQGLTEILYDDSAVGPSEEDLAIDWLEKVADSLPDIRNMHGHGTGNLYPTVFRTFVIVHNIIGQLFEDRHIPSQTT